METPWCAACATTILGLIQALDTDMSKHSTQNLGVGDLEIEFYELELEKYLNLNWKSKQRERELDGLTLPNGDA